MEENQERAGKFGEMKYMKKDNIFSQDKEEGKKFESVFEDFYKKRFPALVKIIRVPQGSSLDKEGIDVVLILKAGIPIFVQEKARRQNWGDLLIEFYHEDNKSGRKTIGWIQKIKADYMLYFPPAGHFYFFPVRELKEWLANNLDSLPPAKGALNKVEGNYTTYSTHISYDKVPKLEVYDKDF